MIFRIFDNYNLLLFLFLYTMDNGRFKSLPLLLFKSFSVLYLNILNSIWFSETLCTKWIIEK